MNILKKLFGSKPVEGNAALPWEHSDVLCMAPFVHQYFMPEGKVFPCCISAHDVNDNLGDLSKGETLESIWNSEATKNLWRRMIEGQKSDMCRLCYEYEKLGKTSSRMEMNEMFAQHAGLINQTQKDGTLLPYRLRYIDFRFSNICNLRCRTCSHIFSSQWFEEAKLMGFADPSGRSMIYPVDDIETLWQQIQPVLSDLERVHFAGGEPLMMEEHYRILEELIRLGKTDVQITYNTNFSDLRYKRYRVLELWKNFQYVSVGASLDAMGERGELMRKGLSWARVEQNRRDMLEQCPHVRWVLTPTVSIMNVFHLPDFFTDWVNRGLMQPKEINIYVLFEPYYYNISTLPEALKDQVRKKYAHFYAEVLSTFDESTRTFLVNQFDTILRHMEQPLKDGVRIDDIHEEFRRFNGSLDKMRNEHFEEVFPELSSLMH